MEKKGEALSFDEVAARWKKNSITLAMWILTGVVECFSISNFEWCDKFIGNLIKECQGCGDRMPFSPASGFFVKFENRNWILENILKKKDDLFFLVPAVIAFEKKSGIFITDEKPLVGYRKIGAFLGVSPETAKKYKKQDLPIHRDEKSRSVRAYPRELNLWREKRGIKKAIV